MEWTKLRTRYKGKTETLSLECSDPEQIVPVKLTHTIFADMNDSRDFYCIDLYKLGKRFQNHSGFEGINTRAIGKKIAIGSLLFYTRQNALPKMVKK